MFRMKGPAATPMAQDAPPTAPDAPPEPLAIPDDANPTPILPDAPSASGRHELDKVSPQTACYLGPEDGPFECEHCVHFIEGGACELVKGPIDPEGCCNLFETNGASSEHTDDALNNPEGDPEAENVTPIEPSPDYALAKEA